MKKWTTLIRKQCAQAALCGRYWTYPSGQWDALCEIAEQEDGIILADVLRGSGLRIADRSQDGAVHIG